jgi:hypothetical protein
MGASRAYSGKFMRRRRDWKWLSQRQSDLMVTFLNSPSASEQTEFACQVGMSLELKTLFSSSTAKRLAP